MADNNMKQLIQYVAESLVDDPSAVRVNQTEGPDAIIVELNVAPEDMGKVIGRQGRIAREIRTLIRSVAQRSNTRVTVEIVD